MEAKGNYHLIIYFNCDVCWMLYTYMDQPAFTIIIFFPLSLASTAVMNSIWHMAMISSTHNGLINIKINDSMTKWPTCQVNVM